MDTNKEVKALLKRQAGEFSEWNARPEQIATFWTEANAKLLGYAEGKPDFVSIQRQTSYLQIWHYNKFAATVFAQNIGLPTEFALSARYAMWTVLLSESKARKNRGGGLLKDSAACYLSLQIIAGWKQQTIAVGDALREGLDTPLLDLRINDRHDAGELFPHFWFLLHLYSAWRGLPPIDISLYSYPPDLGPYAAVLTDWKTADVAQVAQWVEAMAEHHVQQTEDSDPDYVHEFDNEDIKLFPYEIFAFLRMREWLGLPNPTAFTHPLMNQPLGRFPPSLPAMEVPTPLLDRVVARYRKDYPDLRIVS